MTDHLNERSKSYLALSDEERISKIHDEKWIRYTKAKEILARLEQLLKRPRVNRMKNLLLVGETNNGKTRILKRFQKLHPGDDNPEGDAIFLPVLLIQCPPVPDEGRFYNEILSKLHAPFNRRARPGDKLHEVKVTLEKIDAKMLILDEIHNVLAGTSAKQRLFLNVLKYLGNELKITIVAAGIDEAFNVLASDPQLANRFDSVVLPRWELNGDFISLLVSFERALPLREPSLLAKNEDIRLKLHSMSAGLIGELSDILKGAAELAIRTKKERIDLGILKKLKWQHPSERKTGSSLGEIPNGV